MSTEGTTHFHGVGLRGLLATPLAAKAQQAGKVYRIGFLLPSLPPPPGTPPRAPEDVVAGLRDLGYVAGQNVVYQVRYGFDRDALTLAAEELVRSKVDLPYAWGTTSTIAARRATTTIPIVLCNVRDPVRQGFVNSLAHPGGNVTTATETSVLQHDSSREPAVAMFCPLPGGHETVTCWPELRARLLGLGSWMDSRCPDDGLGGSARTRVADRSRHFGDRA